MSVSDIVKPQIDHGKLFINGRWEDSAEGRTIDVLNPATGELLTTVPDAGAGDMDRAVKAARESSEKKTRRGMDPSKKEKILWNIAETLLKHRDELAMLESLENGKTVREAAGPVWINTCNGFDTGSPFGGYKQSGFGRDLDSYALDQYTNVKSVWITL